MTHGLQLARSARKHPDRVAIRCGADHRTYAQLDVRVTSLARGLQQRGVGKGDRVALLMRNRVEFVEAFYAAARLGAVAVPINFRLVAAEVAHIIGDADASLVIVEDALREVALEAVATLAADPAVVVVGSGPVSSPATAYEEWFAAPESSTDDADELGLDVDDHDPLCILYTSGTTGRPKGAVISHYSMALQSMARVHVQGLEPGRDVWLSGLQLFHVGVLCSLLPSLMIGGEFIVLDGAGVDPARIADLLEEHRVTTCSLVPSQWKEFVELPGVEQRDFALRRVSWGTATSDTTTLARLEELFGGIEIYNIYGQTEMAGVACTMAGEDARRHRDSIGRPLGFLDVRVVDDEGKDVPNGEVGELVFRGPTVTSGYWRNDAANEAAFAGGWFHSGDLGRQDDTGLLWIVDRKKDMIISGGENIYSAEVENAVAAHPGVAQVAVIGLPHPRWGETPVAFVVAADPSAPPTQESVIEFCATRMASYKKPTKVVVVEALPRNATGKVEKFRLREPGAVPSAPTAS